MESINVNSSKIDDVRSNINNYILLTKVALFGIVIVVAIIAKMFISSVNYVNVDSTITEINNNGILNYTLSAVYKYNGIDYGYNDKIFFGYNKKIGDVYRISIDSKNPTRIKNQHGYVLLFAFVISLLLIITIVLLFSSSNSLKDIVKLNVLKKKEEGNFN